MSTTSASTRGRNKNRQGRTRVTARDPRTLEVRQFFRLPDSDETSANYSVDLYLYFPRSFGLNPDVWGKERFYRDTQIFLRLDAPELTMSRLCDLTDDHNPLALLKAQLPQLLEAEAPPGEATVYLAKLYGAALADALNREGAILKAMLRDSSIDSTELSRSVDGFCRNGQSALGALGQVLNQALAFSAVVHPSLRPSLKFAEEYAAAVMDEVLSGLGLALEKADHIRDGSGDITRIRMVLIRALDLLNQRRRQRGFTMPKLGESEYFAYRMGRLKKELQRSLYVNTRATGRDPFLANSAAMVAAGLAATWATLAQVPLLSGKLWSREGIFLFAGAVGAYVLKDRIKDWVKSRLSRRLIQWDQDHRVVGDTLAGVGLGSFSGRERERFRWVAEQAVPPEVARLRRAKRTVRGSTTELENVAHYHQELTLMADSETPPPAGYGILEILRFSLNDILRRLDEPRDSVSFYDEARGRFRVQRMPKVYHLNVIHQITDQTTGLSVMGRSRVVLDQSGVVRVEPVSNRRLTLSAG